MTDNAQIIADYPADGNYPAFRDAIYVPMDEYASLSDADKDALRLERYEAFKAVIDNPPAPEPVAEVTGTQEQLTEMRQQAADLLARIDAALASGA